MPLVLPTAEDACLTAMPVQSVERPVQKALCSSSSSIPGDSWGSTRLASDGYPDSDVDLCELDVASDTDLPQTVQLKGVPSCSNDMFDFDDLPDDFTKPEAKTSSLGGAAVLAGVNSMPQHFARRASPRRDLHRLEEKSVEVAMLINGSRGDVQPFVALAQELGRRGRRSVILTNQDFLEFCTSAGVEAVCTFASWSALFDELGGLKCPDSEEKKANPSRAGVAVHAGKY